jgi:hypothetical protein
MNDMSHKIVGDYIMSDELARCRPWIEDALEYCNGTHIFEDVVKGIAESRMQLWAAPRGCMVTEIMVYPRKKVLNIFLAGGDLEQLLDMNDAMTEWAKMQGCTGGTITGRVGWKKVLEPMGWKLMHSHYAKEAE